MKKRAERAIKILKGYIPQLAGIKTAVEGNTWKAKVNDSLVLYLGIESALVKRFEKLYFTNAVVKAYGGNVIGTYTEHVFKEENKKHFEDLINAAIHHIEQNGVKDDHIRTNLLSQFSTTQILGGIIVAGGIMFSAGVFIGNAQKDRELISTERDRDEAKSNYTKLSEENKKQENALIVLKAQAEEAQGKYNLIKIKYDSLINVPKKNLDK